MRLLRFLWRAACAPLDLLDHLIEERKLVRRLLVVWAACLITFVTLEIIAVLSKMSEITGPVTSFYLGVTALLTAVIAFYQWSREKDDAGKDRTDRKD
jgi:uncharacterized membrane protein